MEDTVLVTGSAGFIGSCLVRQLLAKDLRQVVSFDKLTYAGNLDSFGVARHDPRHIFIRGDVCDEVQLGNVLQTYRPSAIIHLAAESHVDRSIDGPEVFVQTNVLGTFRLLEAARAYWTSLNASHRDRFRILHVSTDEVYGSANIGESFTETSRFQPNSPYAASKAAADHFVRAYFQTYGLPVMTTNCSNNYGPFQFPEKLIPLLTLNALSGKPLPIYGDGQNVRDWLFVEDHCEALRLVLSRGIPGDVYNIGGDALRTNFEVVTTLCQIIDQLAPNLPLRPTSKLITFVRDRPGHDRRYAVDSNKIRRSLGWSPRESLESGLQRTVTWYLKNDEWIDRVSSGAYRQERLGLQRCNNSNPLLT